MKNICFQMTRKAWITLVMILCLSFPALAQKITVSGNVSDPTGEPLIGASVIAQGTTMGVATDFDGNYSLAVEPNAIIEVSYIGYQPQSIAVDGRTIINVVLQENSVVLNEVVAIGYGVVKKSDATGSVAMIKPDEIDAGLATSAQDLLVGASPGVVVTSNGGNPMGGATIRIRGGASLNATNNPLVVIDGVPMSDKLYSGSDPLNMISPDNIESMTILKDASATAIYGSRASNGVIIVTTKKGQSGKPQVNFSANMHVNTPRNTLDLMNGDQFREVVNSRIGTESAIAQLGTANTNWQDEILRTSISHDYNLSVGGQYRNIPYRVSASYANNNGILETSGMQRTTVGINLSPKFFNGKLSINANVKGVYVKSRDADQGALGAAASFNPTLPVKSNYATTGVAGAYAFNGYTNVIVGGGALEAMAAQNPVQILMDRNNQSEVFSSTGNFQVDYALHFLPELHFNLNLGYDVTKNVVHDITAANSVMTWRNNDTGYGNGAEMYRRRHELARNTLLDFYVNYRKEFEEIKSNVDAMAGYSWQRFDEFGTDLNYINSLGYYTTGNSPLWNDGTYTLEQDPSTADYVGTVKKVTTQPWNNILFLQSFFGRLMYSFDDTYLLTFTLRDDGTSRFSPDTRWGLFPSVALAWKLNNMSFMKGAQDVMNDLKLRLGWGITGQQAIGNSNHDYYPYMAIYTASNAPGLYPSPDGNGWISPLYPEAYDPSIKWEETTTWNIGLDMAFLDNRITAALDWYLRDTEDLLARIPVAGVNTSNFMTRNIGSLRNYGIEATITAKPVVTKDFTWSTSYNIAWNRNEITKLTGNANTDSPVNARDTPSGIGTRLQWHAVGEPAYSFRVYQQVYDEMGDPVPGQYVDQNADGKIDSEDLIYYHSPDPKVTMTWNNTFNYKKWDLGITLRASLGNYVYNGQKYDRSRLYSVEGYGLSNLMNNTYLFANTDENLILSDYLVEDGSFLRCDNITLGYTFDNLLKDQLRLRLFGAVQNPFVITKYTGLDPEVYDGIDNNVYPRPVTFSLGLVATF